MAIDASRAFFKTGYKDTFLASLSVADADKATLRATRDEVRSAIRSGFQEWDVRGTWFNRLDCTEGYGQVRNEARSST